MFNRRKKPDRGSNYNTHSKNDEEASKDIETKLESDLDLELESFTYVIRNFDLNDSKSSCSISSTSFKDNVEDFETKGNYLAVFNKLKRPLKRSPNRPDLLLYNIGTTDHIVNDRKWFRDDYTPNRGQLKILKTGGSPVISKDSDTAVFIVLFQINPSKYYKIVFEDVLYLFNIDVNLFNSLKHYKSGGYFQKNRLYTSQEKIITKLNIAKIGFFIPLKRPKNNGAFANFYYGSYKDDFYILIPARPLKIGSNKPNASKRVTPKPGPHRLKDRHRSVVSKRVTTGNNSFKDLNS